MSHPDSLLHHYDRRGQRRIHAADHQQPIRIRIVHHSLNAFHDLSRLNRVSRGAYFQIHVRGWQAKLISQ